MTDKEKIIIDGVDVSGCKEYIWALSHVCNLVNGRTDKFECNYYPNCYFKQLQRKEQECEELKKTVLTKCPNCNSEYLTSKGIELYEENKRLKKECEELKERIKCNCFDPKSNNNRCISYNRIAEDYERDLKRLENKIAECEKYEQALEEIELLITNHISSCEKCPDNKNGYCIGIDECSSRCLKKISDIINEAKDGK